jgi:RNA polymerase sigma-70 factor (ECF subfamily)
MAYAGSGDSELVAKLQKRDSDGLSAAYDLYGPVVYSLLYRITRDHAAAEDLTQEAFLRVWSRIAYFDSAKGTLELWISAIARNLGIDYVRSAGSKFRGKLRCLDQTEQLALSYKPSEPELLIHNARLVREAFQSLNSNQKQVLELAYFEGLSQTEIAERLSQPVGTVKSCMRSALLKLRMAGKAGANT